MDLINIYLIPYLIVFSAGLFLWAGSRIPLSGVAAVISLWLMLAAVSFSHGWPAAKWQMPTGQKTVYYCFQDTALIAPLHQPHQTRWYAWDCPDDLQEMVAHGPVVMGEAEEFSVGGGSVDEYTPLAKYNDK